MRPLSLVSSAALGIIAASALGQQPPQNNTLANKYGKLPLSFEINKGQTHSKVNFISRGSGYSLFLTPNEAVFSLSKHQAKPKNGKKCAPVAPSVLRMKLLGANPNPKSVGEAKLSGTVNYFKGKDPNTWRTNIGTYGKVRYQSVYKGIDQVFYGNQQKLEYDFVVSPFADYKQVKMEFAGAKSVTLLATGELKLNLKGGSVTWQAPVVYQEANGKRTKVAGKYVLQGRNRVGFEVARYDHSKPLVIDPILTYSTFLGSNEFEQGNSIAVDSSGNAYITGHLFSSSFPTTAGAFDETYNAGFDAFVAKFNTDGTALIYSTYLGGAGSDEANGIVVDSSGNATITGKTTSSDFPTTAGAYDESSNGIDDVFVTKLNATGTALTYSTFLGGLGGDIGYGIALDSTGNALVTGSTGSNTFPTTAGAYDTSINNDVGTLDAFVTKLNATGTALTYSTFLGGAAADQANGIAVDSSGNATIAGGTFSTNFPTTAGAYDTSQNGSADAFVTKLSADGTTLTYSTFLGGSGYDQANGIAVGSSGNAYVTGYTLSTGFPTTTGAFDESHNGGGHDGFVTKFSADGTALSYSTFLGGSGQEEGVEIALDSAGNAVVTGYTGSTNFPTTTGAYDTSFNGSSDGFVTQLHTKGGVLLYSTFIGGNENDGSIGIALDNSGNVFITGYTADGTTDFPTTAGVYSTTQNGGNYDAFVTKLALWKSPYLIVPNINVQYGSTSVTLKAKLTHAYDGSGISGKTISVTVDGGASADYTTDSNGDASFTYDASAKNVGDVVPITASFAGDSTYDAKTAAGSVSIKIASTTLIIAPAVLQSNYRLGQAMSPQISVTMTAAGNAVSGATLDFTLNGTSIGNAVTNASGVATLPYTPLALGPGKLPLVVSYTATTNYTGRTRTGNVTFSKTPTAIALPVVTGDRNTSVNLVATLTDKDTNAPLAGRTLTFFVNGVQEGTAVTNASGVATLPTTLGGTAQKQTLSATFYPGEATYAASAKTSLLITK